MRNADVVNDGVVPPPPQVTARYRAAGIWRAELLHDYVLRVAAQRPASIALVSGTERLSYANLTAIVSRMQDCLRESGLARHDRLLIQSPNSVELLTTCLAAIGCGVRPVLCVPTLGERETTHVIGAARPRAALVSSRHEPFAVLSHPGWVRAPSWPGQQLLLRSVPEPASAGRPGASEPSDVPGDVAMYLLSAGTTGLPKPIPRTHQDYVCNIEVSNGICDVGSATVYLAALPFTHNFALGCPGILGVLAAGGRVVLSKPEPSAILDVIEREGVTMTAVVPTLGLRLAHAARVVRRNLSSLRLVQIGGSRLTCADASQISQSLGTPIQQVYGMAEGLLNFTRLDDPAKVVLRTQGRPASPFDEWRIVDEAGQDVVTGKAGELLVRGPYTIRGYLARPEVNAAAFTAEAYYRTGDLVRLDPSGNFVVEGRLHDVVNCGGEKVSVREVEELLSGHPAVGQCAAVAMPHDLLGEAVCVYIVPSGPEDVNLRMVREFLHSLGVARFKLPARLEMVSELPTTGIGKLDRAELRRDVRRRITAS